MNLHFLIFSLIALVAADNASAGSDSSRIDESVAIVEWQFPTDSLQFTVHPLQQSLAADASLDPAHEVFAPALSSVNQAAPPEALNRLTTHSMALYQAVAAGRSNPEPSPFLLNFSLSLPSAIELLISKGVRIFSFSSSLKGTWPELDAVIRNHPDVIFVMAIPHISGNDIPIEKLEGSPMSLARESLPNVFWAGSLKIYDYHHDRHVAGKKLGSTENPVTIDNQPGGDPASKFYMLSPETSSTFGNKIGGTSAAAPHLANLVSLTIQHLKSKGQQPTVAAIRSHLSAVMESVIAEEKDRTARSVLYFTLDTVLGNLGLPLRTSLFSDVDLALPAKPKTFAENTSSQPKNRRSACERIVSKELPTALRAEKGVVK